jgi:hypothetical protein
MLRQAARPANAAALPALGFCVCVLAAGSATPGHAASGGLDALLSASSPPSALSPSADGLHALLAAAGDAVGGVEDGRQGGGGGAAGMGGLAAVPGDAAALLGAGTADGRRQLFAGSSAGGGSVGLASYPKFRPPTIRVSGGRFTASRDSHEIAGQGGLVSDTVAEPGAGIFVDFANVTLKHNFTAVDLDGVPIPKSGCSALGTCPNTTIAETYFRVARCRDPHCADDPTGFSSRRAQQAILDDRRKADGTYSEEPGPRRGTYEAPNRGLGPHMLEEGFLVHPYQAPATQVPWTPGTYLFEAFTALVDVTKRTTMWTPSSSADVLAISQVVYVNITVLPGAAPPIFDPPQDFYSEAVNVTLETVSPDAHVFYTLQPPFIYDENGTWCPHMGSWCSSFPADQTFHAVPNQPPDFWYSRRGLFNQLLDVPYESTWNFSAPPRHFPFGAELGFDNLFQFLNDTSPIDESAAAEFVDKLASGQPLLYRKSSVYTPDNVTLYPLYTIEKDEPGPGTWLLFEPVTSKHVEDFHVTVSTCFNHSYYDYQLVTRQRMEDGMQVDYQHNLTLNMSELRCQPVMKAPAANPCPWSRDCKLLGEVSFKLRAYALRIGWVDSVTTSGLYTFIQSGFPRWMNTRDNCGGWRQSTANPYIKYAVSERTVWDVLAPYDCPPGYHWASTAEGVDILGYEGDDNVPWARESNDTRMLWETDNPRRHEQRFARHFTHGEQEWVLAYADQCGWEEFEWEDQQRRYFRFSDSGPRYVQYMPAAGVNWPDELHLITGEAPASASRPHSDIDTYRSHIAAWYWYQHNENFTLSPPYELPDLFDGPTNATWAMKAADSLDYLGLEVWTGDNLGHQSEFAGAICRTNGDWTPPRIVILGSLTITLEVHTIYVEYGAQAWDPVDDVWYPEWKNHDGILNDIDDGVVRITGRVDHHTPGVYYIYYDATDLHSNHARQQVRTIFVLDRTTPVLTVTAGVHQRACEPWTERNCTAPDVAYTYDGLLSQPCPPLHTCDSQPGGFLYPRGERTRGTEITVEAGTKYIELGATATDNLKDSDALTQNIVTKAVGPLKHLSSVQRAYPVFPMWYMVNLAIEAHTKQLLAQDATDTTQVTAKMVIDLGMVESGEAYGLAQLKNCRDGIGFSQNGVPYATGTDIWLSRFSGARPSYCEFEWQTSRMGVSINSLPWEATCGDSTCPARQYVNPPIVFDVKWLTVWFEDGYEFPCTLSNDQPHIEFDHVNFQLPGVYNVTYDVTDDFNNTANSVSRTVTVKDTTPPVLLLQGDPVMIVRYGEPFNDPGATATDTGDDYYYNLNRMNTTACGGSACTNERVDASINDKIVTRVHHERLECERVPIYPQRNETPPICMQARSGEFAHIKCPINGTVIIGYNFISFGQPEGTCYNKHESLKASSTCFFGIDDEIGEKYPADIAMFNALCLGKSECRLGGDYTFYTPQDTNLGALYEQVDPCPNQPQWLTVEALCAWNSTQEVIGYSVECRDEFVQIPSLGLSGMPPLLGELDRTLPGTRPGHYPLDRFGGTWKNMDDFSSRLDASLGRLNEKFVHQDVWGEREYRKENGKAAVVSVNTTVLGLYVITYDVTDVAGNEATQISRFVIVQDDSELYQNSIQQVYDGTPGTFTGGELPHETGGTLRIASSSTAGLVELSRNRPTNASSLWGVHTPSSAAVDGLYANSYVEPFTPMDRYGRMLAQDHIPNIFMSGPAVWLRADPPTAVQWWQVHLSSVANDPTVVIYTRDCCTDQFGGTLTLFIGDTEAPPVFDSDGRYIATLTPRLTQCAVMTGLLPGGSFETICTGSGAYLFVTGAPYIHFAEVEVYGFGGGHGHGHGSVANMIDGTRSDVGLHHDGAQYSITVPVANVSTSWWVNVPSVAGRQLVLELNTSWPGESRRVRANVFHATPANAFNGSEVWKITATGKLRHSGNEFRAEPESSVTLETYPSGTARSVIGCGPRDDDLREGRYYVSVLAEPIIESDSLLRPTTATGSDDVHTQSIVESKYQAVPYSLRATFIEPIFLPSAVDVTATVSQNITTLYYFETYLNQKIALELAGPEDVETGVSAVLSYGQCTDRDDNWGYRRQGRLQTHKSQSNRPPGYDFLSLCPFELDPGRYYVEIRSRAASSYTLRLSEYTPNCPNNCTGSPYMKWGQLLPAQGRCDCTILRCICEPGFFGDDCSKSPEIVELESYPFMHKSVSLDRHGGGREGQGTLFNMTCPRGHVVVGLTGSYYDYHSPRASMDKLVRRVNLVCQPLLTHGLLGSRSNETVIVTNNHSLSIYSRTLNRYSLRQEYLSPEQLDLDCVTPGGKGHLDECRLLHGIWSSQQTIYTEDEKQYAHTCGANEVLVGQTVDTVALQQTCAEDGFGCTAQVRICNYTINDGTTGQLHNLTIPCHRLCHVVRHMCVSEANTPVPLASMDEATCTTNFNVWTNAVSSSCTNLATGDVVNAAEESSCVALGGSWVPSTNSSCVAYLPLAAPKTIDAIDEFHCTNNTNKWIPVPQYVLCNTTSNATSPWALDEKGQYWPGNDWDWRSQKYFGDYENDYYATFRRDDSLLDTLSMYSLARNLLFAGSDFHGEWHYKESKATPAADPCFSFTQDRCLVTSGCLYDFGTKTCEAANMRTQRRRLQAWDAARRLQIAAADPMSPTIPNISSSAKVLAEVLPANSYQYVTEVGGICEKISFASNTTAPGAAVFVRYEDDRHYPVDKVIGAGSQDNEPSQVGCSQASCPAGDRTDPVHHKQRCAAGMVVTGIISTSGDWLDSVEYVCSPLLLMSAEEARIRALDIDRQEAADLQNTLSLLESLADQFAGLG